MNQDVLVASLKNIRSLASDCLKALDGGSRSSAEATDRTLGKRGGVANKLPDCILEFRDKLFFKEPRTPREVHEKLRGVYACEINRVEVSLLRLVGSKRLRKASKLVDGKRQVAYVW
jgi:hypothetical protein